MSSLSWTCLHVRDYLELFTREEGVFGVVATFGQHRGDYLEPRVNTFDKKMGIEEGSMFGKISKKTNTYSIYLNVLIFINTK